MGSPSGCAAEVRSEGGQMEPGRQCAPASGVVVAGHHIVLTERTHGPPDRVAVCSSLGRVILHGSTAQAMCADNPRNTSGEVSGDSNGESHVVSYQKPSQ
jgi:hypothetical protein